MVTRNSTDTQPPVDPQPVYRFRLYVAGQAPNSLLAVANLRDICFCYLQGRCQIEIIDVLNRPEKAMEDGILVTPTLLKISPDPLQKLIGNMSDRSKVLRLLEIDEQ